MNRLRSWVGYRWLVAALANMAFVLSMMFVGLGLIAPDLMTDFGVGALQLGLLGSVYSIVYATMQIPGGILADRVGPRKTISTFLLIGALGTFLFSQAPSYQVALAAKVLVALGVSVLYVNQVKVLARWFAPGEFATVMGLTGTLAASIRMLLGPAIALLVDRYGWRTVWATGAAIGLVLSVLCWVLIRNGPEDLQPASDVHAKTRDGPRSSISVASSLRLCWGRSQFLLSFAIALLTYGGSMAFDGAWGQPFLMQGYGLSRVTVASLGVVQSVFAMVSGPMWGYLSDRRLHSRRLVLGTGVIGGTLFLLPLVLFAERLTVAGVVLILVLRGIASSAFILNYTMVKEAAPDAIVGVVIASLNIGPYVGGAIMQAAMGWVLDSSGRTMVNGTPVYSLSSYQQALWLVLGSMVLASILMFWTRETYRRPVASGVQVPSGSQSA